MIRSYALPRLNWSLLGAIIVGLFCMPNSTAILTDGVGPSDSAALLAGMKSKERIRAVPILVMIFIIAGHFLCLAANVYLAKGTCEHLGPVRVASH